MSYQANVLALDPVAYWPLNDASAPFADNSGNGNNATVFSAPLFEQTGPEQLGLDKSVDFDGIDDYGQVGSALATGMAATLVGWFRTDDTATQQTILSIGDGGGAEYIRLSLQGGAAPETARIYAQVRWGTGGGDFSQSNSTASYGSGWHFAAATFNNGTAIAYLDDVAGTPVAYTNPGSLSLTGIARLSRAAPVHHFNGGLAGCAVFNKILTPEEISGLLVPASGSAVQRRQRYLAPGLGLRTT